MSRHKAIIFSEMNKKVLLMLTGREKESLILKKILSSKADKVFLCAVEYNAAEAVQGLKASISAKTPAEAEIVDFQGKFNSAAFNLKESYLDFIHETAEKDFIRGINLKKYFKYPSKKFSLWWLSLIFEKNPYKSPVYTLFAKAITILRLKEEFQCQEIWMNGDNVSPSRLLNALNSENRNRREITLVFIEILRAAKFIAQVFLKALSVRKLKYPIGRSQCYQTGKTAAVTMFPFIDEEKLKEGIFCNLAYGPLQKAIEQACGEKVTWRWACLPRLILLHGRRR